MLIRSVRITNWKFLQCWVVKAEHVLTIRESFVLLRYANLYTWFKARAFVPFESNFRSLFPYIFTYDFLENVSETCMPCILLWRKVFRLLWLIIEPIFTSFEACNWLNNYGISSDLDTIKCNSNNWSGHKTSRELKFITADSS
jgi:hypothetical protein